MLIPLMHLLSLLLILYRGGASSPMGYDVHITRATHWTDSPEHAISLDEWTSYLRSDKEMRLDNRATGVTTAGDTVVTESPGIAVWVSWKKDVLETATPGSPTAMAKSPSRIPTARSHGRCLRSRSPSKPESRETRGRHTMRTAILTNHKSPFRRLRPNKRLKLAGALVLKGAECSCPRGPGLWSNGLAPAGESPAA